MIHEDHAPVTSVKFSPNGKYILAWTLDSSVRLWNYVDGRCVKTYQGHSNTKFSIGGSFGTYFKHGGSAIHSGADELYRESPSALLVSGSEEGSLWIWDVGTKNVLQTLEKAHSGVIFGAHTHPTAQLIASGGEDGTVKLWQCGEQVEAEAEAEAEEAHFMMEVDKTIPDIDDGARNVQDGETMDLDDVALIQSEASV
jgi:COMPASS component SWD3